MGKGWTNQTAVGWTLEQFVAAGAACQADAAAKAFVRDACRHSGLPTQELDAEAAIYHWLDEQGEWCGPLGLESLVPFEGEQVRLEALIAGNIAHGTEALARAIWALESFQAVNAFLLSLRCLVRYAHDAGGQLTAQVVPSIAVLPLIERIERGEHLDGGGGLSVDSVTRLLGLRRKVLLLDFQRRQDGAEPAPDRKPLGRTRAEQPD